MEISDKALESLQQAYELNPGLATKLNLALQIQDRTRIHLRIIAGLMIALVGLVVLCAFLYRQSTQLPPPLYFSVDNEGKLLAFLPLNEPIRSTAAVKEFAASTVECVKTLNAVEAERQIESCRDRFTRETFGAFLTDMKEEGVIAGLRSEGMIQDAQAGAPIITEQGVGPTGEYEYTVDVPVKLSISTGKDLRRFADLTTRLRVRRVDPRTRVNGLVITKINDTN